jgi:hypothetical protein
MSIDLVWSDLIVACVGALFGGGATYLVQQDRHRHEREMRQQDQESETERRRAEVCARALAAASDSWDAALRLRSKGGEQAWEDAQREKNASTADLRSYAKDTVDAYHGVYAVTDTLAQTVRNRDDIDEEILSDLKHQWRAARDHFLDQVG